MFLTPYTHLTWAYQLHYHLCFRTHRRRPSLDENSPLLEDVLKRLCDIHGYHSLEMKLRASDAQLLLSLRPHHRISDVLKKLKGESSTALCPQLGIVPPLWARGYLARSAGRVRLRSQEVSESTNTPRLRPARSPPSLSLPLACTSGIISGSREL